MAKGNQMNSHIGDGSSFEGKFYISGNVQIDGKFRGEIKTEETLVIGAKGKVKTNIFAKNVIVAGTLIGDITAKDKVTFNHTGKILGNLETPNLEVAEGVIYRGNVNITGGHKKDIKKIVDESLGDNPINSSTS